MSALTRVFFIFTFLLGCFLLFKPAAFAQTLNQTPQSQSIQQSMYSDTNPNVPKNLHTFTQNVMIEVMSAMICQISGIDPINGSQGCLGIDPQSKKIGFVKNGGGLIGVLSNSIATLYTPPLHTSDYFKYMAANFGITKNAYASNDRGYNSITPLAGIWLTARNVAYLFFVILFLIIGIGIMLRIHIDPRTVMTIQNQIPKIIIAIVLVTFSFAIAGLLIDLMYIISYLLLGIIASSDVSLGGGAAAFAFRLVSSTNPLDAANTVTNTLGTCGGAIDVTKGCFGNLPISGLADLAAQPAGLVTGMVANAFGSPAGKFIATILGTIIGAIIGHTAGAEAGGIASIVTVGISLIGAPFTGGASLALIPFAASVGNFTTQILSGAGAVIGLTMGDTILSTVAGIITFLIILIAILVTLFRLWFQLIMAYISVLLNIVFAPIWIMLGLIPGSKINFSAWIRNLIGNLSCFPTALVMFLMARVFIDAFVASGSGGSDPTKFSPTLFTAPLVGNPADIKGLAAIIGMGIFLMTPSAVTQVKNALSGGSGISFGGIGQSLSAGAAVPMAGIKGVAATRMKTPMPGEAAGWRGLARLWGMG